MSFLAAEAIENYLAAQIWQVQTTKEAVKKADSQSAKFVDHEQVVDWLNSWGSQHEKERPK